MRFLPFLTLTLLTACASGPAPRDMGLATMSGLPVSQLYAVYGVPEQTQTLPDGGTTYTWERYISRIDYSGYRDRGRNKIHAKTIGGKIMKDIFLEDDKDDGVVNESCAFTVTTRNGIVSEAMIDDDESMACDEYLNRWHNYRHGNETIFNKPQP